MEFMNCSSCKATVEKNKSGICLKCRHEFNQNTINTLKDRQKDIEDDISKNNLKKCANKKK